MKQQNPTGFKTRIASTHSQPYSGMNSFGYGGSVKIMSMLLSGMALDNSRASPQVIEFSSYGPIIKSRCRRQPILNIARLGVYVARGLISHHSAFGGVSWSSGLHVTHSPRLYFSSKSDDHFANLQRQKGSQWKYLHERSSKITIMIKRCLFILLHPLLGFVLVGGEQFLGE